METNCNFFKPICNRRFMNQAKNEHTRQASSDARRSNHNTQRRTGEKTRAAAVSSRKEHPGGRQQSLLTVLRVKLRQELRHIRRRWNHIVKEERRRNFPESDRLPIQLILMVWGLLPMAASFAEEVSLGRRSRGLRKAGGGDPLRRDYHLLHSAAFIVAACSLAAVILLASVYTRGTTVLYKGEVIAVVESGEAVEEVRTNLETVTTRALGETFVLDDSQIQYSSGWEKRQDIVAKETLEEELSEEIGLVTLAYCLYVDDVFIGATPYEGALEALLEQLKQSAIDENTVSCGFAEEVEIREEYMPKDQMMNLGYLAEILYSTKSEEVIYEVQKGDTWTWIAERNGMTSDELLELNPGYNIDKLQIGEQLTLSAAVPYLTMTVVRQERYVDQVNYEVEYTDTPDMYQGDIRVTSKGKYGSADVVANVTYVNGEETARTVVSSVTLVEPVTEQQLRGTTPRPTWYPTGTFRWPTTGRISSYFGGRKSPGGIGSTNHKGLDIANGIGTAIYAADGGTVTYSGWLGGYGYAVKIRHDGTGYETLYGHNSKLLVSAGDKVYKGQQIAKMGSTGNSTGSHCHFEVIYKGVQQNPLNYLP
ncbi:MAG: M23 family metallopeptidase [Ruminococcaceae bacterium]|nr:M23 family metallopeptidase [Oscillospiraceae bacterium]